MVRRSKNYGAYALDKFELPHDVREELQAREDRSQKARARREERARKRSLQTRPAVLGTVTDSRSGKPAATFPGRPLDSEEHTYVEGFAAHIDELNSSDRRSSDAEERARNKKAAARLLEVGPWRPAVRLARDWRRDLQLLRARFPNFATVLDVIRTWFAFAEREPSGRRITAFPPVLLNGAPGIGKTMFVEALAKALHLPWHRVDMASAQTSARLAGSDEYWSNSKPGLLFEILAFADHEGIANSIVLLDEIEKAGTDQRHDPLGALYTLLERRTAKTFADLAFPRIRLDASHLLFIATANDVSCLPAAIHSRMRVFDVPGLTEEGSRLVIRNLCDEIAESLGLHTPPLSSTVLSRLAGLAPRTIRQVLEESFGRALEVGRDELRPEDVVVPSTPVSPGRIGFFHENRR